MTQLAVQESHYAVTSVITDDSYKFSLWAAFFVCCYLALCGFLGHLWLFWRVISALLNWLTCGKRRVSAPLPASPSRALTRWRWATRKIVEVLRLRRVWHSLGVWLQQGWIRNLVEGLTRRHGVLVRPVQRTRTLLPQPPPQVPIYDFPVPLASPPRRGPRRPTGLQ